MAGLGASGVPVFASEPPSYLARLSDLGARASRPLRLLLPHGSEDNLAPVVEAFRAASGCQVELQVVPLSDVATVLALDTLSGAREIDVALPATFALPDLVRTGAIVPLSDFAAEHETPGLVDGMLYDKGNVYDGQRYGYQTDGDVYVMFLNRRLFDSPALRGGYEDRYGIELKVPRTWEELDRQMLHFDAPGAGRHGGTLFRSASLVVWEWWLRLHGKGVWPVAPDMTPAFEGPEALEALNDLIAVTGVQLENPDILGDRYGQGDAYANLGWGGTQKSLRVGSSLRDDLIFAAPPGGVIDGHTVTMPYFNWGWSYVVSAGSPMQELSYLFCLMAVEPELSTVAVRRDQGFFDPFRREHYSDAIIGEVYTTEFLAIHHDVLARAIPDFYLPGRTRYFARLGTWLARAASGALDPKVALSEATRDWRAITLEEGAQEQAAHWQALRTIYPEPLRSALRDVG